MARSAIVVALPPDEADPVASELLMAGFEVITVERPHQLESALKARRDVALAILDGEIDDDETFAYGEVLRTSGRPVPTLTVVAQQAFDRWAALDEDSGNEYFTRPYSADSIRWRVEAMCVRRETVDDGSGPVLKVDATGGDAWTKRGTMIVVFNPKGGVGKTTVAAAIAVELASRGIQVHLTTTDPAEHLAETLQANVPGLRVSRIDPVKEALHYREHALATRGAGLDAPALAVLEEDLRSPCYDELAVFQAFSRIVVGARKELVVLDTAPTGHTLLLLETAELYHRKMVGAGRSNRLARLVTPLMRLRDPRHTKVLIVSLPETTPVLEAAALQEDLRRAEIEPFAWVINASLAAARPRDPILVQRAAAEVAQIRRVRDELAPRVAIIPFQTEEPVGPALLRRLTGVP